MCGIAGVVYSDASRAVDPNVLKRMADAILHRGPDDGDMWMDGGVGLAHRRLSIIDVHGGRQPIANEDGTVHIVFNGEIYNFRELREELVSKGHRFQTFSDTEVIVHLYEEMGPKCVERLRGMFAFAIWDSKHRRLLLARDRVGIKPLYISQTKDRLVFGSELKAVLAHGDIDRDIDPRAIDEYLNFGMIPGSRCIFRGVEKLLPARAVTIDVDNWQVNSRHYWQLNFQPDESLSIDDWKYALLHKLRQSVRMHLVSDVPLGAFLSGGLDSSIVTALASEALPTPIQTFSMGFREARFNELPAAREIANHFGTEHREEQVTPDAVSLLPKLAHYYDEPFADSSAVPTYLLSEIASRDVKVALSGDGGDEALGGYSRYAHDLKEARIRSLIPAFLRGGLLRSIAEYWPRADWLPRPLRLKTFLANMARTPDCAYANTLSLCRQPGRGQLLDADIRAALPDVPVGIAAIHGFRSSGTSDPLSGMIAADMATLLPDDYLVKVDRASMAHGLEVRPPMLDHEFLELCATIPSKWKINNSETKWLLRETAQTLLPPEILKRPKQGFEIPIDNWFRGPLVEMYNDLVTTEQSPLQGIINTQEATRLLASHRNGISRNGSTLWSLLSLAVWCDTHMKSTSADTQAVSQSTIVASGAAV